MSAVAGTRDHWPALARHWARVGPPLRPSPDDLDAFQAALAAHGSAQNLLLLGVTPEIASLPHPPGTRLTAIDSSWEMIDYVWPRASLPSEFTAIEGNWLALPCADHTVDVVLGDGSLSFFHWPDTYGEIARELHRVLRPEGHLVVRVYARPEVPETVDAVRADLDAGRIGSVHALKWRIAMALGANVPVSDVYEVFVDFGGPALFDRHGWPAQGLATIEGYARSPIVYSFPTVSDVERSLAAQFRLIDRRQGTYELAERCPVLSFSSRI
jgi:SAM-dependent methyltransferase